MLTVTDDLDKSLLLYITHTCTEMGIKIPCQYDCPMILTKLTCLDDEVARRMGSTFTEGAIQQHIAKLRTKMAELNVVPVPAPPRRGTVTTRPSGVYSQKARTVPSISTATTNRQRSTTIGASIMDDEQIEQQPAPVRRGRGKRRKTVVIKRSESDVGESDEDFEAADDEEYVAQGTNKRKRSGQAQTGRSRASKIATPHDEFQSKSAEMMRQLQQADDAYDAEVANADYDDVEATQDTDGPASRTRGIQFDYSQFNPSNIAEQGEEEEEEANPSQVNAEFQYQALKNAGYAPYFQDGNVSPTSQALTIPQQQDVTNPPEQMFTHFQQPEVETNYHFAHTSNHAVSTEQHVGCERKY